MFANEKAWHGTNSIRTYIRKKEYGLFLTGKIRTTAKLCITLLGCFILMSLNLIFAKAEILGNPLTSDE